MTIVRPCYLQKIKVMQGAFDDLDYLNRINPNYKDADKFMAEAREKVLIM
jgi:hypothetical protein